MKRKNIDALIHKLEMLEAEDIYISDNKVEALLYDGPTEVRDGTTDDSPFKSLCWWIRGTQWRMKIRYWVVGGQWAVELTEDE